jgi:Trk K+ transport system NAD-binding subunit
MYVIVAGGGKVGYYLTQHLLAEGHEPRPRHRDQRRPRRRRGERRRRGGGDAGSGRSPAG